jgi:hypothetical protein
LVFISRSAWQGLFGNCCGERDMLNIRRFALSS